MAKFGCLPRFIAMVRQFHDGMQTRVQNDGEFSEPFAVTNGVKQVCETLMGSNKYVRPGQYTSVIQRDLTIST